MLRKYDTCTEKLRFSSWRCGSVLRVLDLRYKVAIFELEMRKCTSRVLDLHCKVATFELELRKCTSRTRLALQSCDFRAGDTKCTSRTRLVLQSCDFRAGDVEVYLAFLSCTTKLRFSSWRCGSVLRVLDLCYKVAIFKLELRKCTLRTRLVLQSCDFRAGASEVYCAYLSCATKLRFLSWSCGSVFRVLDLYCKLAIFELELRKCISRT